MTPADTARASAARLGDVALGVLFTAGMSLKRWDEVGTLSRELEIYRRLATRLRRVDLVTYGGPDDLAYAPRVEPLGVVPARWHRWRWLTAAALLRTHGPRLRDIRVLKTNQVPGSDVGVRLKRRLGCRLVVRAGYPYARDVGLEGLGRRHVRRALALEADAYGAADAIVVTTPVGREWVCARHGIPSARVHVVPNYVDTHRFAPRPEIAKRYDGVFVGRAGVAKNTQALVAAVRLLADRGRAPRIAFVGGVAGDAELRRSAAGLPVEFIGRVANEALPEILAASRTFLLPSIFEGHPKALLEAMAMGLPCIGADVPGIREELGPSGGGVLIPPTGEAIAESLAELLGDADRCVGLGARGRAWIVDRYAIERVLALELDVLDGVAGG